MSTTAVHLYSQASVRGEAAHSHLRLTRRGRIVLTALAAAPLIAGALYLGIDSGTAAAGGDEPATSSAGFEHVTVKPGQSLWQIAETVAPHQDPRDVISAIVDLNGLQSSVVAPGQSLAIPAQYAK